MLADAADFTPAKNIIDLNNDGFQSRNLLVQGVYFQAPLVRAKRWCKNLDTACPRIKSL